MKKTLLLIASVLAGFTAGASHAQGGELRYEYTGSGYKIVLNLFAECANLNAGIPASTQTVALQSTACNSSTSYTLNLSQIDTLTAMYCPGSVPTCGGSTPLYLIYRYSVNVPSIAPCSDWKFSFSEGSRDNGISNLSSPNTQNVYLEAMLNNSAAPNSSPIFGTDPSYVSFVNMPATRPFQVLDIEGDSLSGAMYQPQTARNAGIAYNAGFSLSSPLGSANSSILDIAGGTIKTTGVISGKFALAARAYDYRNGVMVGYSSRDWVISNYASGSEYKTPLPAAGTAFVTSTCPGASTTMNFHFTDSLANDSVSLTVLPQNGYAHTNSYSTSATGGHAITTWTTPASLNPATTPYYFFKVLAVDNHCPRREFATYTVLVKTASCAADSVWPGDANADKVVNMYDPLFVALAYGKTGAIRPGASTLWLPIACTPWATSFNTGINMKHADCSGNGTVDSLDLLAIAANYGQVHARGSEEPRARGVGIPDLYFDHTGITAAPGATISVPVKLGNSTNPMGNMLGIAGTVRVSNITPTSLSIAYPSSSWIGTQLKTVRFSKQTGGNTLDWAVARNDQQNVTGQGQIGTVSITIPAGTAGQKIVLNMEHIKIIDAMGNELSQYNVLSDTISIAPTAIGNVNKQGINAVVVPNPSNTRAALSISLQNASLLHITVLDITGRAVWQQSGTYQQGTQDLDLPTTLRSGLYLVRIANGDSAATIKWTKSE